MKKSPLLAGLCLLGFIAPVGAFAQKSEGPKAKLMAKYDLNKNGVIDGDEVAAVRKDFAADPKGELKRFDTDNDGKLSDEEIAKIKPPGGKKAEVKTDATTPAAEPAVTPIPSKTP